jgi:hypothetical protein
MTQKSKNQYGICDFYRAKQEKRGKSAAKSGKLSGLIPDIKKCVFTTKKLVFNEDLT